MSALNLQRRDIVEVDVGDLGRVHRVEVLGLQLLLQMDGNQILQHLLPDIAGKLLADQVGGRLAGAEARQFGAFLDVVDDAAGLALHYINGDGNLQRVLATFY